MPTTIYFRGTYEQARQMIAQLPTILAGRAADPAQVARGVQLRLSTALLSQVQQDFLVKSRGGTGKDGVRWPALDPKTIAARTRTATEVRDFKRAKKRDPKLTALAFYGSRKVDMLRDTSRLFRSLTPGVEDRPAGNPDQVITLGRGMLILGSKCPYLGAHQNGTKHVPARPVFPVHGTIPPAYWPALNIALIQGIIRALEIFNRSRP